MRKIILMVVCLITLTSCGRYYHHISEVEQDFILELEAFDLHPHDTVASIGAGDGYMEVALGLFTDEVTFFLEDLDSSWLNQEDVEWTIQEFDQIREKPQTNAFKVTYGNENNTNLPRKTFHKVILSLSFHHFSHTNEMIQDIHHILKDSGQVYVCENVWTKKKKECAEGYMLWKEDELIQAFEENNFRLAQTYDLNDVKDFKKPSPYRIFVFKKKSFFHD